MDANEFPEKYQKDWFITQPPLHPGKVLENLLLKQFDMTTRDVSERSGVAAAILDEIIDGKLDVSKSIAKSLEAPFGRAADTLYRLQRVYDYYQEKKIRPTGKDLARIIGR